jgi:hypothetical protein
MCGRIIGSLYFSEIKIKLIYYEACLSKEKAIERDQYSCVKCGLSREESEKKYGEDLCVARIDGNNENNELNNLETLCRKCFIQYAFLAKNRITTKKKENSLGENDKIFREKQNIEQWETELCYWSSQPLTGYKYSEKRKAWWKLKSK